MFVQKNVVVDMSYCLHWESVWSITIMQNACHFNPLTPKI